MMGGGGVTRAGWVWAGRSRMVTGMVTAMVNGVATRLPAQEGA